MRNRLYIASAVLAMVVSLVPIVRHSHASDEFFTIQAGTFSLNAFEYARKQAMQLFQSLPKANRGDVRIEEGNRYLNVRVGKFRDMASAEKVLGLVKETAVDAFIYQAGSSEKVRVIQIRGKDEKPLPVPEEYYSLQTGKFLRYEHAEEKFRSISEKTAGKGVDDLRIIQAGDFFRIRMGRFPTSLAAEEAQKKLSEDVAVTSMVRVYAKEENIITTNASEKTAPAGRSARKEPDTGTVAGRQSRKAEAVSDTEELDKLFSDVHSYFGNREYVKVSELVRKGLARWPDNPDLHAWQGALLLATGFPDKAYEAYRRAAALQPEVPEYHSGVGHSLLDTHLDRARNSAEAFKKALTIDPNNSGALEGLGILYVSTGRKYLASEIYERLKQIDQVAAERLNQFILYGLDWDMR